MSAIDPNRLARQAEGLASMPDEPEHIAHAVRDLVEEYSGQTRSSVPSVPMPVIRALLAALQQHEQPIAVSEAIWNEGLPDAQLLAAGLLKQIEDPEVAPIAKRWTSQNAPIEIVRELAERRLMGWRLADPDGFMAQITHWLDEPRGRGRVLALYALRERISDPDFEDLPTIFGLVGGRLGGVRGEMREAIVALIAALHSIVPEETVNFLNDEDPNPLVKTLRARFNPLSIRMV